MNDTNITVPIQRLPNGAGLDLPAYASNAAAGMDLRAADDVVIRRGQWATVATGFAIALPSGYEAQVRPRSGLAVRHGVTLLNSPGTIDADYRGEIQVLLINHGTAPFAVTRGMRIAQLVIAAVARVQLRELAALGETPRGTGGFGSTGASSV